MNSITPQLKSEAEAAYQFPSLSALKKTHYKLLEAENESDEPDPSFLEDARDFVLRACATGRILEDCDERGVAQTLLNYWATVLMRAGLGDRMPSTSLADMDESAGRDFDDEECPYFGIEAYSENQAHLFHGRKVVVDDWVKQLHEHDLLIVYGPSGSGKTSLIRAGMIPAWREAVEKEGATWKVIEAPIPDANPTQTLEAMLRQASGDSRALLCIYRFDEAILHSQKAAQQKRIDMIEAWLSEPGCQRRFIGASRMEAAAALKTRLADSKLGPRSAEVAIPPFSAAELRACIENPADQIGLRFEPGLVETLIGEVSGEPAALSLLQFTLLKLWGRRERNRITWDAHAATGGAQFVVEKTAEAVFGALSKEQQQLTERIFLRLVRPSLTREFVACGALESALLPDVADRPAVKQIVDRFVEAGLLRFSQDRPGPGAGERLVEVAHESLLRKWPRIWEWMDLARLDLLQRQRIEIAATAWKESGRDPSTLWSGIQLSGACAIIDQLSPGEREFIEASQGRAHRRRLRNRVLLTAVIALLAVLSLWQREIKLQERARAVEYAVNLSLERAERLVQTGDPAGAFLFFQKAFEVDAKPQVAPFWQLLGSWENGFKIPLDPGREALHNLRLGATWAQLPRLSQTFHLQDLGHCDLSPDGQYLAGISDSGGAVVWKFGEELVTTKSLPLEDATALRPTWAAFHPDPGQALLAVAFQAKTDTQRLEHGEVRFYDARTGKIALPAIAFPHGVPQKIFFSPATAKESALLVLSRPEGGRATAIEFSATDIRDLPGLLKRLRPDSDPLSKYLWSQFSETEQKQLAAGGLDEQRDLLVKLLNRVVSGPSIYDERIFGTANLGPEIVRLKDLKATGDDLRRLNRLLLEDGYPADLARTLAEASVWDYRQGQRLAAPLPHGAPLNWAAFSPDGQWIVTAAGDLDRFEAGEARVWLWRKDQQVRIPQQSGPFSYAEFDAEGQRVVTAEGSNDDPRGSARVWSVSSRGKDQSLQVLALTAPLNHRGAVTRARFSPDGQWLATGSRDRTARVWNIDAEKAVWSFSHSGEVLDVAFSPDGRFLASGGRDRAASLWELATGQPLLPPFNHSETVSEIFFRPDGRRLVTVSRHLARSWDAAAGEPQAPFLAHRESVMVSVSGDGRRIFTVSTPTKEGTTLDVWEAATGRSIASRTLQPGVQVLFGELNAAGHRLALSTRDSKLQPLLRVFAIDSASARLEKEDLRLAPELNGREVALAAFDPSGKMLALGLRQPGRKECVMALAEFASGKLEVLPGSAPTLLERLQFSSSGDLLAASYMRTGSDNGFAQIWKVGGQPAAARAEVQHDTEITSIDFSPDEQWFLTGSTDDNARLWPVAGGPGKALLEAPSSKPGGDPSVAKQPAADRHTHTADLTRVRFSSKGGRIITTAKDQTAILWQFDSKSGEVKRTAALRHDAYVSDASFSKDGDLVLTASDEPKLRVWSAASGELIALLSPIAPVTASGFAAEGRGLFAIGQCFSNLSKQIGNPADRDGGQSSIYEVRPMNWSFVPLRTDGNKQMFMRSMKEIGQMVAARKVGSKTLEKMDTADVHGAWESEFPEYRSWLPPEIASPEYHRRTADECEATEQWAAAAWHISQLLAGETDPAKKIELLKRRAIAYAKADGREFHLPKCIEDHLALVALAPASDLELVELAEVYLAYGAVTREEDAWESAIKALRAAEVLAPKEARIPLLIGQALAGRRMFEAAEKEFQKAVRLGSTSAGARLAFMKWMIQGPDGRAEYRNLCRALLDPKTAPEAAYPLLWPSVLTNAFEGADQSEFQEAVVRQARVSLEQSPANPYRRNTYGAALFRAGHYEKAIEELEQARAAYLAERVNDLARHYDYRVRVPIWRPGEGRPQDWLFLALAKARLAQSSGNLELKTEAWDWLRRALDAPELARVKRARKVELKLTPGQLVGPVPYDSLALELLYFEAYDLLTSTPSSSGVTMRSEAASRPVLPP